MQLPLLLSLAGAALAAPEVLLPRAAITITVDPATKYQPIDGFGFSEAFQRANLMVNMPSPKKEALLDVLFNTTTGAGFSILRTGIGSSPDSSSDHMNTIEPKSPGSPTAAPNYVWDGKDSGQLWVAQQAVKYGVKTFYANAWSAPGYMKTNNNENNGGYLCGVSGHTCTSGDWTKAYADYLIQYVKYYAAAGVNITHLGFLNEPEFSASYASMQSSGTTAADFIKVLQPALVTAGLSNINITCCDSEGWSNQQQMTTQLRSAGVEPMIGVITSHTYNSNFNGPIKTSAKVWQTEYSDLNGAWTTNWYSSGAAGEGQTWASTLHTALTSANCSGYLYWVATQNGNTNEMMIKADATSYTVSKRLWALAQYSRFIRPGATRIGTSGSGMSITAFVNLDGSYVIPCLNTGSSANTVSIALKVGGGSWAGATVTAWITDQTHAMEATAATIGADGTVAGAVPARSFVTYFVKPAAAAPAA